MASKAKKKKHRDGGDASERPEAKVFFRTVHEIKAFAAREGAKLAAAALDVSEDELRPFFLEAIGLAFFELLSTIDRTGGPNDFPRIELTLEDGDSLNANFLHDLYCEYEPEDEAKVIEKVQRQRPPEKHEIVVKDEKQALGLLKAFTKISGVNVHVHDTHFETARPREKRPRRRKKR
jgi:hypothetical protein